MDTKIYVFGMGSESGVKYIMPVLGRNGMDAENNYIKQLCSVYPQFKLEEFWSAAGQTGYGSSELTVCRVDGYDLA